MCGIAGRLNFVSGAPVDPATIRRMASLIAHRGPDGEAVYTDGPVGLGHRRLAIIDLHPSASQPMASADRSLWITYNGEIYNFPELRRDLEARGHAFRTQSDTEVILAAYREFGVDCLTRLRGMFAFAIWDARTRTLFVARDRLGKKPLHYLLDRDGLAFASEPKAFLADLGFTPRPSLEALSYYLTYQYVPSPHSAFQGVRKLPPAHYLLVKDGRVSVTRYWRLGYARKVSLSEDEAVEELGRRLRDAVRCRLISDVPVGAFLSGGIDSSAVVAIMAESGAAPVKTFSIGFEEAAYDERRFARMVAERYGTDHHEFVVRPQAIEILPKLAWHYDEPFADSSAIPTYCLAELTRPHVTVALNGDGGDENFAGYERYAAHAAAARYAGLPGPMRTALASVARLIPTSPRMPRLLARGRRWLDGAEDPPERRYVRWMSHFHASLKRELCTEDFRREAGGGEAERLVLDLFRDSDAPDLVDRTLDVDVRTYLPDDLLVKVDIATMAHGLEGRSPLLDHELMEWSASLPSSMKLRRLAKKHIFKRAVADLLPPPVTARRKMGFGVPIDRWFRGELRDLARDVILGRRARERGYFQPAVVTRLVEEHVNGIRDWHYQLWNLLMLELWHQTYVDARGDASGPGPGAPGAHRGAPAVHA
jgi:asparagine synthase (glutamine-hydrolysing)